MAGVSDEEELLGLVRDRGSLDRTSTAERVAAVLRGRIIDGTLAPGIRLAEDTVAVALGVSRNTLREAFRLLSHERLLRHELNRGVFVRRLTAADVVDLYRVRRLVEVAAVRTSLRPSLAMEALRSAVGEGTLAARQDRWRDVGTANMRFHQALVGLAASPRLDELMRQILAELRLVFAVMPDPRKFHEPYLSRNAALLRQIEMGDLEGAANVLETYLHDAERQLVSAYGSQLPA